MTNFDNCRMSDRDLLDDKNTTYVNMIFAKLRNLNLGVGYMPYQEQVTERTKNILSKLNKLSELRKRKIVIF